MRAFEKMRHDMFRRAIEKNVVLEPHWHSRLNNAFIIWAMRQRAPVQKEIPNKLAYEKAELNPLTQKYWEHTFGLMTAPAGVVPWLIELARITIPESSMGICKSFEQVVIHEDIQNPLYFSESTNWGNPFVLPANLTITWFFRLERIGPEPPQINISTPAFRSVLPGEPHFDHPEMTDLWFPAASPVSQNIHLTIGGRYRLRVLALVERTVAYDVSISAKIRGFRLSAYDSLTLMSLRSNW